MNQTMPTGAQTTEILLIEDDPMAANLFVQQMKHFAPGEFDVTQARSLQAGLDEAGATAFGLAVIDLTLPDSVGIDTCSKFSSAQPEIPFLVLTGVADAPLSETLAKAGASAAFVKDDCQGQELVDAVRMAAGSVRRNRLEVTQKVTQARFRNAIVDSADGILVIGQGGNIVLVSAGAESLLGRTAAELTGSPLGIDLKPGVPVRAQMLREEPGHTGVHQGAGAVREFDVCRLHVNEVEFWPFAHVWANKPVTVCAMRDVSNQTVEELRQRNIARLDEPLEVSEGIESVCTDIAVRLGSLIKFNRFEASLWNAELDRMQIMFEIGAKSSGRTVSAVVERGHSPFGFGSWMTEMSSETEAPRVAVSVGAIDPGSFGRRDSAVIARCATVIASATASIQNTPVLSPSEQTGSGLDGLQTRSYSMRDSSMPGAA